MTSLLRRILGAASRTWNQLFSIAHEELALKLSLLLFLLHGGHDSWARTGVRILCCVLLLHQQTLQKRWLWSLLAAILMVDLYTNRFQVDNHVFLIAYWSMVCCFATWSSDSRAILTWNGRCLIALTFTFATFWKFFGGEYLNGSFFLFELLKDARFASLATLTGIDAAALEMNRHASDLLRVFPSDGLALNLNANESLRQLAVGLSYGTILIEGAVAAAFFWALKGTESDMPDSVLIAFCIATYTLTPVLGFGFVLIVMGFAQSAERSRDTREAYLLTFIIVQFATLDHIRIASSLIE